MAIIRPQSDPFVIKLESESEEEDKERKTNDTYKRKIAKIDLVELENSRLKLERDKAYEHILRLETSLKSMRHVHKIDAYKFKIRTTLLSLNRSKLIKMNRNLKSDNLRLNNRLNKFSKLTKYINKLQVEIKQMDNQEKTKPEVTSKVKIFF